MSFLIGRKVGVLSDSEIEAEGIISGNFDPKSLKRASYDLRLGDEYYIPPAYSNKPNTNKTQKPPIISKCSDDNNVLRIKAFSSIVFSTEEILKLPNNIVGRFDMRIVFAMQGLVLQVGPQVEPNYEGRLFGLLLNFSNQDISIPRYTRLLTIEFSYLSQIPQNIEKEESSHVFLVDFLKKSHPVIGTLEAFLSRIETEHDEMQELDNNMKAKFQKMENSRNEFWHKTFTIMLAGWTLIFTISIPYLTLFISKRTIDKDDYPFERIIRLENQRDSLREANATMQRDIQFLKDQVETLEIKEINRTSNKGRK